MNSNNPVSNGSNPVFGWRLLLRGISKILLIVCILAGILFVSAGRLDWVSGWILVLLYMAYLTAIMIWGIRKAPDLLLERGKVSGNVKQWDKFINAFYAILIVLLLVVSGLDAQRYRWTNLPTRFVVMGGLGLATAGWVIWRTMIENAYLSRWARIQDDRGQKVITTGPYSLVRHPMYSAIILLVVCIPIQLGSLWGLIPSVLISILFVVRTHLEDRMLLGELEGYQEYANRVKSRLLPGIW
jgi:protein-S-isoprenylcysteine O-methyltransferase Ste14